MRIRRAILKRKNKSAIFAYRAENTDCQYSVYINNQYVTDDESGGSLTVEVPLKFIENLDRKVELEVKIKPKKGKQLASDCNFRGQLVVYPNPNAQRMKEAYSIHEIDFSGVPNENSEPGKYEKPIDLDKVDSSLLTDGIKITTEHSLELQVNKKDGSVVFKKKLTF